MGLKEIEKEIRKEGKKEIRQIEKVTKEQVQKVRKEITKTAKKAYEKEKTERKKELSVLPKKIISDARMLKRRKVNAKKLQLLEKVFNKAQERISQLDEKKKSEILKKLIAPAKEIKNPVIYVDKKYAHLLKGVTRVKESKINDLGVIIEGQKGSLRIDNRLSSVMERVRTTVEPEVARILFKEKNVFNRG